MQKTCVRRAAAVLVVTITLASAPAAVAAPRHRDRWERGKQSVVRVIEWLFDRFSPPLP